MKDLYELENEEHGCSKGRTDPSWSALSVFSLAEYQILDRAGVIDRLKLLPSYKQTYLSQKQDTIL